MQEEAIFVNNHGELLVQKECFVCNKCVLEKYFCSECNKTRLVQCPKKKLAESKLEARQQRKRLNEILTRLRSVQRKQQKKELLTIRIASLKNRMSLQAHELKKEKEEVERFRRSLLVKFLNLLKAQRSLLLLQNVQLNNSKNIERLLQEKKAIYTELGSKRRGLIAELLSILPVNPISETESVIVNIVLPNNGDFTPVPQHVLSSGLGYIVHLVNLVTRYLNVWLPFPMEYFASRSLIWDQSQDYPLFLRSDKQEFLIGIELLAKNIDWLCYSQGVMVQNPATLLPNLRLLFNNSFLCDKVVVENLFNEQQTVSSTAVKPTSKSIILDEFEDEEWETIEVPDAASVEYV